MTSRPDPKASQRVGERSVGWQGIPGAHASDREWRRRDDKAARIAEGAKVVGKVARGIAVIASPSDSVMLAPPIVVVGRDR